MPEQPPPKHRPPVVRSDAEQRARELSQGLGKKQVVDAAQVARDALEEIAALSARSWGSDEERDRALATINERALAALTKCEGRNS